MALTWRARLALLCSFVFVSLAASQTEGTLPSVRDPIPPISFDSWRQVNAEDEEEDGYAEFAMSFPSAFSSPYPENARVPLTIFMPRNRPEKCPVVVILHYLGAKDLRAERKMGKEFALRGMGSVILTLPFHLQRTPAGHVSGALAIQPDPEHLLAMMTQSTIDVRRTLDWIYSRTEFDTNRIGVCGISLGALVASLSYAVDSRFTHAALVVGGVDLAHILWTSSIVISDRDKLRRKGINEDVLREKLAPIEPLNFLKDRKGGKAFVVGAKYDTVIPPVDVRKLIDALDHPQTLWLETGHYGGIFVQNRLTRLVADFFATEFRDQSFVAPRGVYAPTIRIGAQADTFDGIQIALGLDIYRSGRMGDAFASLLVTPKSPSLFFGYHLSGGISPGVFVGADGVAFGVYWSFVL